ncbi:hypothetical protein PCA20602_04508 [Pandoraea capi]|uniref:Uncharacterized protein n=1 Tax=Pandoraea capi TaxID=2508286 RepID=A0ABY6WC45_9BURK|nr:hypothetical protein [Pandoraea capi]VVE47643.1 hypothetical protein PCA20602_04508 [Pandoraea capi]
MLPPLGPSSIALQPAESSAVCPTLHDKSHALIVALEAKIRSPDGAGVADFEAFLADIETIDEVSDAGLRWAQGRDAHDLSGLRKALAFCQLSAYPDGRQYLVDRASHYPIETGECSLRVFRRLSPELRAEMLFQSEVPWCRFEDAVKVFNDGLITVRIPRTSWFVPILPTGANNAEGRITAGEMLTFLRKRFTFGPTIGESIALARTGLTRDAGQALADWHLKIAGAYETAGQPSSAAMEYVSACEVALSVDVFPYLLCGVAGAVRALEDCRSVGVIYQQGRRLLGLLDVRGLRLMSAEVALLVASRLDHLEASPLNKALRENASPCFERLGLPVGPGLSVAVLAPAIRSAIARRSEAFVGDALRFGAYRIRFVDMGDPHAGIDFREDAEQSWMLLARRHPTPGCDGVFDVVASETGNRVKETHVHPQTKMRVVEGELFQGMLVLDMLQAAGGDVPELNWLEVLAQAFRERAGPASQSPAAVSPPVMLDERLDVDVLSDATQSTLGLRRRHVR